MEKTVQQTKNVASKVYATQKRGIQLLAKGKGRKIDWLVFCINGSSAYKNK